MGFLVRKVLRAKWGDPIPNDVRPIPADAVTNCLRTSKDTLSVWYIEDASQESIDRAVLALAGSQENCQSFSFLILEEADVLDMGLSLDANAGKTVVRDLDQMHRDISGVNYDSLGKMAAYIRELIAIGSETTITASNVKRKLRQALDAGLIDESSMHRRMRKDLGLANETCEICGQEKS